MRQSPPASATTLAQVTVVEAEGCHFCADASDALAAFATRYPLSITTIDARDPAGIELMQQHRAAMSPLVLVDGSFFSQGRLPRGRFQRLLEVRSAAVSR